LGGLYLSIVLAAPKDHPTLLPLALGARLALALGERYSLSLRVKWPNDVLVTAASFPPRKIAGILVDLVASPKFGAAAVAGIGVNVAADPAIFPEELRQSATSLAGLRTSPPSLDEVEGIVVRSARVAAAALRTPEGVASTRALCRRLLYGVGRRATVDGRPAGRIAALGDEGELLLDQGSDRVTIRAGDLRVEETA
jgi:BirA family biotin operon repressor/biotin-[acetyl-CoA-carboxylase] ligase